MTTLQNWVDITRDRYLVGGANEVRNKLSATYSANGTTLAFSYPITGISPNSTLGIGLEVFYVVSVDSSAQTAVVIGGQRGSTPANHNTGDLVRVNPRYTDFEIIGALNEEIVSLGSPLTGLFSVKQAEVAFAAAQVGYNLPGVTDITSILEVRYDAPGVDRSTPRIDPSQYRLERSYLVGENSSGLSLKVYAGGYPGKNLTVIYRSGFTALTNLTDDVTLTGLPTTAYDIPPMGAALRLGVGREIRRNDIVAQGDTRRAEEVGPGAAASSWRGLQSLRQRRLEEEAAALLARYPLVAP